MSNHPSSIELNGRSYAWPQQPLVVICCDGSEPEYTDRAMHDGTMPNLKRIMERGEVHVGRCVIPSFTNPNNLSIVTGQPPSVHGICGNFLFDKESGEEVLMNDPKYLRVPTIFEAFQKAGGKVAVLTAKDKLRRLLGHGLSFGDGSAVCFSSEHADKCTMEDNGITDVPAMVGMDVPDVYSAELSEFVFAAGVKLLKSMQPDLLYLSTTDYIQHKFAPGTDGANAFYAMIDRYLGEIDAAGATFVFTADHGMSAKHTVAEEPDILYLQELLDGWYGEGKTRVILPITDPYVVHHGALGSFATVYLEEGIDAGALIERLRLQDLIEVVYSREEGCRVFELPEDRVGDIIVVSRDSKVLGTAAARHDLSGLKEPLRSHGGISEQRVPVIVNRRMSEVPEGLRNFDAFFIGCNNVVLKQEAAA